MNLVDQVNTASTKKVLNSLNLNFAKKEHTKMNQAKLSARPALIPTIAQLDPKLVISASQENSSIPKLVFALTALLDTSALWVNRWISVTREPSLRLVLKSAQSAHKVTSAKKAPQSLPLATSWISAKQVPQRTETE